MARTVRKPFHGALISLGNLILVLVVYFVVPVETGEKQVTILFQLMVTVAAIAASVWVVVRGFKNQGRARTGMSFIIVLEIVLVAFAFTYYLLETRHPGQIDGLHTRIDSLYFTVTVIGTVGFGDISAQGQTARAIVTLNILFNLGFLAALSGLLRAHVTGGAVTAGSLTRTLEVDPRTTPPPETD